MPVLRMSMEVVFAVAMLWMTAASAGARLLQGVEEASSLSPSPLEFKCPPGFISFGTSLSDTGSVAFAFPGTLNSESAPYGETFFGRNAFRFSDGRLVVDFFDMAFGYPLLSSYFQAVAPDFRYGVNFAASGATALPETNLSPLTFGVQVREFLRFHQSTLEAKHDHGVPYEVKKLLPDPILFRDGLYLTSFGRNDFTIAYTTQGYTPANVSALVPQMVASIVAGIKDLYNDGARQFLVFNVPPQGCSPQYLTLFGPSASSLDYDEYGCLAPFNKINQLFDVDLLAAVKELRTTLNGSLILYYDYYQANIAILQNPKSFGISPNKTLVACCGVGGQYKYNPNVTCSTNGTINNVNVTTGSCSNPSEHISWDGVHFTDAYNGIIAKMLLSGHYLDPPINMHTTCNLDFSKFQGVNFTQAYPDGYIIGPPSWLPKRTPHHI